ncbi:MAG: ATP-binding protein [Candidatus Saccharibacteria bacterium]
MAQSDTKSPKVSDKQILNNLTKWTKSIDDSNSQKDVLARLARGMKEIIPKSSILTAAFGPTGLLDSLDDSNMPKDYEESLTVALSIDMLPPIAESYSMPSWLLPKNDNASSRYRYYWPLVSGKDALGYYIILSNAEINNETLERIQLLSHIAGLKLRDIRLTHAASSSLAETLALQRITQAITKSLDFETVASTLLSHTITLFDVDAAALYLVDSTKSYLEIKSSNGLSDDFVAQSRVGVDFPDIKATIAKRQPIQVYDVGEIEQTENAKLVIKEGMSSMIFAPIVTGKTLVGALVLFSKIPQHFAYSQIRFSQSLAEQAGIALANADLHNNLINVSNEIEQTRNLMRDGLLVVDLNHNLRYYNAAAGNILGLSKQSLDKPFTIDQIGLKTEVSIAQEALTSAISKAISGGWTSTSFTAQGNTTTHFEAVYSPYRNTNTDIIGVLVNIRDITSLYAEKEKLQTILGTIQDGLVIMDLAGLVQESNREWHSLFDERDDVIGQPFLELISRRPGINFDQNIAEVMAQVAKGKRLLVYAIINDTNRHLQISFGPVMSAGQVSGIVATARDITTLIDKTVEANEMAAKAGRHLRELSQLAELSGIVGFNVANIYQKYLVKLTALLSSPHANIYLYEPGKQELLSQDPNVSADAMNFKLESDHPVVKAFLGRRAISTDTESGFTLAVPVVHHSKTLGVVVVERQNDRYLEHDAKLLRLVATRLAVLIENATLYHDVNSRRERWEAVFRFTEDGIVIFDRHGTIVGFNPAASDITQYHGSEALGKSFDQIIKTVAAESGTLEASKPLYRVIGEGVTIAKSEELIESRTGNRLWTEISYSPMFDDAGRVTSGIAIIRNIQKDREIEEIKSDFISIVSHELRTPLTAIKGFLSMILKQDFGPLSEKQNHYLSRVYQSNQRMIDLVEDLLESSYIESGKISLTINPVSMENIVGEVVSEVAGKGAAKQIMVKVNRQHRLPLVLADETRLHQILLNLVDNAIKYSNPETEVRIDFKVQADELITIVTDHGVGISGSQIERLFTKFGRIYNPMSVQAGGTGLGLYIVKNLVESHGGRIWVTSREGKGSKFHFSLPIAKQLPLLG